MEKSSNRGDPRLVTESRNEDYVQIIAGCGCIQSIQNSRMKKPVSLKFILLIAVPSTAVFIAVYVTGFTLLFLNFMKWLFSSS